MMLDEYTRRDGQRSVSGRSGRLARLAWLGASHRGAGEAGVVGSVS